jgi:predicted regulator of Ras-like GTPase activity (Roadblock/LC7/MglB family)
MSKDTTEAKIRAIIDRIKNVKGVQSVTLSDREGFPLMSTIDTGPEAEKLSGVISHVIGKLTLLSNNGDEIPRSITVKTDSKQVIATPYGNNTLIVTRKNM